MLAPFICREADMVEGKGKCRVRVDDDFTVPMCKLKKKGCWKERKKEYWAGEWLKGYFVEIDGCWMFLSGEFLLSPSRFDRVKFPQEKRMSSKDQEELLKSLSSHPDLYDPHKVFTSL